MSAMPTGVLSIRADACAACATPCARRGDVAWQASPCVACPAGIWPAWRRCAPGEAGEVGMGDRVAALIEERLLGPIERAVPTAAGLVEAVRRCGVCKGEKARLNGDGGGSAI